MMDKIKAVIFDFGGVLIQMEDDAPRLELAKRLGVTLAQLDHWVFDSPSARKAALGQLTIGQHWQAIAQGLDIPADKLSEVIANFWSADRLNEELVQLIRSLRPHYKIGLLSNAWDDLRQVMNERFHIAELFDQMFISAEVKLVKPDPRIYHLAAEGLGVSSAETVFIDDMEENVAAARQEGLQAIQYLNNEQTKRDLNRLLENRQE